MAIERTGAMRGRYFVLGRLLSPLEGIGPEELKVRELLRRMDEGVKEVILALNPSVEGEMTTLYLAKMLRPLGVKVTRIARGIPLGSALEFIDEATIARAIEGRVDA
jgi:recombination protein RecR